MTETTVELEKRVRGGSGLAGKYLTFSLSDEEYGIEILKVREIIGMMETTTVPHTPPYVKGVVNLRGRVIPIIDLRLKFDMDERDYDERTCIIVVDIRAGSFLVGMVVDAVSEVLNVQERDIEPPPAFGSRLGGSDSILGMAQIDGNIKILVDVDKIVGDKVTLCFQDD